MRATAAPSGSPPIRCCDGRDCVPSGALMSVARWRLRVKHSGAKLLQQRRKLKALVWGEAGREACKCAAMMREVFFDERATLGREFKTMRTPIVVAAHALHEPVGHEPFDEARHIAAGHE